MVIHINKRLSYKKDLIIFQNIELAIKISVVCLSTNEFMVNHPVYKCFDDTYDKNNNKKFCIRPS